MILARHRESFTDRTQSLGHTPLDQLLDLVWPGNLGLGQRKGSESQSASGGHLSFGESFEPGQGIGLGRR